MTLYINVSLDTLHDEHVLVDGLMVIVYPVISDPPLSDGTVHCIVALLYVVDCTDTVSGALGGSRKFYLVMNINCF